MRYWKQERISPLYHIQLQLQTHQQNTKNLNYLSQSQVKNQQVMTQIHHQGRRTHIHSNNANSHRCTRNQYFSPNYIVKKSKCKNKRKEGQHSCRSSSTKKADNLGLGDSIGSLRVGCRHFPGGVAEEIKSSTVGQYYYPSQYLDYPPFTLNKCIYCVNESQNEYYSKEWKPAQKDPGPSPLKQPYQPPRTAQTQRTHKDLFHISQQLRQLQAQIQKQATHGNQSNFQQRIQKQIQKQKQRAERQDLLHTIRNLQAEMDSNRKRQEDIDRERERERQLREIQRDFQQKERLDVERNRDRIIEAERQRQKILQIQIQNIKKIKQQQHNRELQMQKQRNRQLQTKIKEYEQNLNKKKQKKNQRQKRTLSQQILDNILSQNSHINQLQSSSSQHNDPQPQPHIQHKQTKQVEQNKYTSISTQQQNNRVQDNQFIRDVNGNVIRGNYGKEQGGNRYRYFVEQNGVIVEKFGQNQYENIRGNEVEIQRQRNKEAQIQRERQRLRQKQIQIQKEKVRQQQQLIYLQRQKQLQLEAQKQKILQTQRQRIMQIQKQKIIQIERERQRNKLYSFRDSFVQTNDQSNQNSNQIIQTEYQKQQKSLRQAQLQQQLLLQKQKQTSRNKIFLEKWIHNTLDDNQFRRRIKQKTEEFEKVKVEFESSDSIEINSLMREKDAYVKESEKFIHRIDRIIGDARAGVPITSVNRSIDKQEMYMINIHQAPSNQARPLSSPASQVRQRSSSSVYSNQSFGQNQLQTVRSLPQLNPAINQQILLQGQVNMQKQQNFLQVPQPSVGLIPQVMLVPQSNLTQPNIGNQNVMMQQANLMYHQQGIIQQPNILSQANKPHSPIMPIKNQVQQQAINVRLPSSQINKVNIIPNSNLPVNSVQFPHPSQVNTLQKFDNVKVSESNSVKLESYSKIKPKPKLSISKTQLPVASIYIPDPSRNQLATSPKSSYPVGQSMSSINPSILSNRTIPISNPVPSSPSIPKNPPIPTMSPQSMPFGPLPVHLVANLPVPPKPQQVYEAVSIRRSQVQNKNLPAN